MSTAAILFFRMRLIYSLREAYPQRRHPANLVNVAGVETASTKM